MSILAEQAQAHPAYVRRLGQPCAIKGWPLPLLISLERRGAPGLLADLTTASPYLRQSVFLVLALVDFSQPGEFLARLDGESEFGEALRRRHPEDLLRAALNRPLPANLGPLRRALLRVADPHLGDPLADPAAYRRLAEIMLGDRQDPLTRALRYCGPISAATIQAADALDAVLCNNEVLKLVGGTDAARRVNRIAGLLRASCSTLSDREIIGGILRALRDGTMHEHVQAVLIDRADRLPVPSIPTADGIEPMTSAEDLTRLGREMSICTDRLIAKIASGLLSVLRVEHRTMDGTIIPVVVQIEPLSEGRWLVTEIKLAGNRRASPEMRAGVLARLAALGVLAPAASPIIGGDREMATMLGIWDYNADLATLETAA